MKQPATSAVMIALCVLCVGGVLVASNMALVINYQLTGPASVGGRGTGVNTLSLPYRLPPGIGNAHDLMLDIGGGTIAPVLAVSRFKESGDVFETYTGRMGAPVLAPFPLVPGEGLFVQMAANVNYVVVGSEDPTISIPLESAGGSSSSGKNFFAPPYNTTATNAFQLTVDIGGPNPRFVVSSISKFLATTNTYCTYIPPPRVGGTPCQNYPLVVGEAYFLNMAVTVPYTPSHY